MTRYLFKEYVSRLDFIKQHLNEEDYEFIYRKILELISILPPRFQYNLVLIGPVGVGKSTICTLLYYLLDQAYNDFATDVYCYPEFLQVNSKESHEILKEHLEGSKSSYEFQKYILHCWATMMQTQPLASNTDQCRRFNVFERCCDDSVICFANLWHRISPGSLNEAELQLLFKISQIQNKQFNLPTYFTEDSVVVKKVKSGHIATILLEIINIIRDDFENSSNRTMFIMLDTDVDTLMHRINIRSRPGEHAYNVSTISAFHRHYQLLFDKLEREGRLKDYSDLDELV